MIYELFQGMLYIVTSIIQVILYPIDLLISFFIPNLEVAFIKIGDLFNLIETPFKFLVNMTGLSSFSLSLIFSYFIFKFTLPFQVYIIKLAVKWYKAIKF